jgi:DNA polymerase II small subunit
MGKVLQANSSLKNLVSINKISGNRQTISIIGLVSDKTTTKNKNILLEVEDLTGKIRVLINQNNTKVYEKTKEISLDSVLGFSGVGNREIFFANDIVFPDSSLAERKNSPIDENVLFLGDLHFGSKLFLENNFLKFIDYLNGKFPNTPEAEKIKNLFLVGDVVAGVGNYPNQERDLKIGDIEEQFIGLSELLGKIRKDINIILSPGNHDGVRLMEPQPILNERYAWSIYDLKNVILTGNPSYVNIGATEGFSGFDVLTYHGVSYHYYANTVPKLIMEKALKTSPDKIMAYLLKNRHLAPSHASVQYFPSEEDGLMIRKIPDIFVSAHTHKSAISYYNNILTISTSAWESKTPYQEKMGNEPDFCKVPIFNLKTRAIKILDFEDENKNSC